MPRGVAEYSAPLDTDAVPPVLAAPAVGFEDGPGDDEPAASTTTTVSPTTVRRAPTTTTTAAPSRTTASSAEAAANAEPRGAYALHMNTDGSVVRWNPCLPITWKVNAALAPAGAVEEVATAVSRLAEATGMTFEFGGTTSVVPTETWLHGKSDTRTIVVAWAPKAATDLFAEAADGEGGWYEQGTSPDGETWTWQIIRGYVLMEVGGTAEYAAGFVDGVSRGALLMHELAHAVGLSHVDDKTQLMYPTLSRATVAKYGNGDLLGLAQVGRAAGCIG